MYTTYFQKSQTQEYVSLTSSMDQAVDIESEQQAANVTKVLGVSISKTIENGKEFLSEATGGKSDPIINKALENIQKEVKDLPKETVEKVKYEFCKDVITEYENKSENN